MKMIEKIFEKLYTIKVVQMIKPAVEMFESILLGSNSVTKKSPHMLDNLDLKRYMTMVIIALTPCALASIYFFGWRSLLIILVSYAAGGLTEVTYEVIKKHEIHEGFLVTGLIFPLVLPPNIPLWIVAVGSIFGVIFGKEVFGGTGRNIFNPALVGRIFITIAFPIAMSASWGQPFTSGLAGLTHFGVDAMTAATPLTFLKTGAIPPQSLLDMLFGRVAGSMGETFRIGIIAGGLFLMHTKVSSWRITVSYLGAVAIFAAIGNIFLPDIIAPPLLQLLSGGLLFGAFFMATDPVSSPFTKPGKFIYGIMLGLLTILIRSFSGYVEGVMFSIIIMNAFGPLIDTMVINRKFKPLKRQV